MRKALATILFLVGVLQAQTNIARMLSGVNPQTGTSYTFQPSDVTKLVTFTNPSPVSVLLPSSSTSGYGAGRMFSIQNLGPGTVTITCVGCVIYSDTSVGSATLTLTAGQGADIFSDNLDANYSAEVGSGNGGGLVPSGVTPGTYTYSTITVNQYGIITSAGNGLVAANESVTFTNALSASITTTYASSEIVWSCYDQNGIELQPSYIDIASFPGITFNFATLQSGTCVINGNQAGGGGGGSVLLQTNSDYPFGYTNTNQFLLNLEQGPGVQISNSSGTTTISTGAVLVDPTFSFQACQSGCPYIIGGSSGLTVGSNTVTLTPVPRGISGSDANHWIRILPSGSDAPEPVLITGGTAVSGAASGTLTFTAAYVHGPNYEIQSATSGIQEGVQYALLVPNAPGFSGTKLLLQSNQTYTCYAPITLQNTGGSFFFDGQGATIQHSSFAQCLVIGNSISLANVGNFVMVPTSTAWSVQPTAPSTVTGNPSTQTFTIATCPPTFQANTAGQWLWLAGSYNGRSSTIYGTGEYVITQSGGTCYPGVTNGTIVVAANTNTVTTLFNHGSGYTLSSNVGPYIDDNVGLNSHIHDIRFHTLSAGYGQGNLFQIDGDQACALDNIDASAGYLTRKDADFQSSGVFSLGGAYQPICHLGHNVNISEPSSCVKWYSGNDFFWDAGICQNYSAGGVVFSDRIGGFCQNSYIGPGVHFETGAASPIFGVPVGDPNILDIQGRQCAIQNYSQVSASVGGSSGSLNFSNSSPWPVFPPSSSLTGQTNAEYYYVVNHNNLGTGCTSGGDCTSVPMFIGAALVTNVGSHPVTVSWYGMGAGDVSAASDYEWTTAIDILKLTVADVGFNALPQPPEGTGNWAVVTNQSPASICDIHNICSITDNVTSPSSYTTNYLQNNSKQFYPVNYYSAGGIVLNKLGPTGSQGTSISSVYVGAPNCLQSNEYLGASIPAQFTIQTPGGLINNGCPPIVAPISFQGTMTQCITSASPAQCGSSAPKLFVAIAPSATTLTVNDTQITKTSAIMIKEDTSLGSLLGVTCDTATGRSYQIARTPGTGIVLTASAAPTNSACLAIEVDNR